MKYLPTFDQWIYESSGESLHLKRGKPVLFDPKKYPELKGEIFDLIQTAYAEIGGHVKIKKPDDIFSDPDWTWWEGEDIHGSPDMDIIMFGQHTKFGIKFSGVGHDGEKDSKREYLDLRGKDLKKLGYYIEVSGKLAEVLISKYNVPVVDDETEVQRVLGKNVQWIGKRDGYNGDGWYQRELGGSLHYKIMVGRPKL